MNPPTLRFLRSLCGWPEVVGIVAGSLTWVLWSWIGAMHDGPGWTLLALTLVAALAGFGVAVTHASAGVLPAEAVKAGSRAALGAAAVGVLGLTWAARSELSLSATREVLLTALLSILPAGFFGTVAAGVAALAFAQAPGPAIRFPAPSRTALWLSRAGVVILTGVAVVLPFMARRVVPVPHTITAANQSPPSKPEPPPPFAYEVPADMVDAGAAQWRFEKARILPPPSDACPPALSPDGQFLAYVPGTKGSRELKVFDLHSNEVPHSLWLPAPLAHLVYSPNGRRLFAVTAEAPVHLAIIELHNNTYTPLPQPKNRQLPEGPVWWWQPSFVAFLPPDRPPQVLDLETLILAPASTFADWEKLSDAERYRISDFATRSAAPKSGKWKFGIGQQWMSAELPEVNTAQSWPVSLKGLVAIHSADEVYSRLFPMIVTEDFNEVLGANNGSKVIGVSDSALIAFYFGLRPPPTRRWTVSGLPSLQSDEITPQVREALEAGGQLAAVIYAPLVNPLNNKTVGPDRHKTRGRVFFESWEGNAATIWLAEEWDDVQPGDVVADPHAFPENGEPQLFRFDADARWWGLLPDVPAATAAAAVLPTRVDIEKKQKAFAEKKQAAAKERATAQQASSPPPSQSPPTSDPSPPAIQNLRRASIAVAMRGFLRDHHERATRGDVQAMVSNYSDVVDYFDSGSVPRSFILDDSLKYRQRIQVNRETIVGDESIEELSFNEWQVSYRLNVDAVTLYPPAGKPAGGDFVVTLKIRKVGDSFQIFHHRARRVTPRN